jgi:hypothetical protein
LRSKSMTAAIIISLSLAPVWRAVPNPHCLYGQKQVEIKQIRQINNIERCKNERDNEEKGTEHT